MTSSTNYCGCKSDKIRFCSKSYFYGRKQGIDLQNDNIIVKYFQCSNWQNSHAILQAFLSSLGKLDFYTFDTIILEDIELQTTNYHFSRVLTL